LRKRTAQGRAETRREATPDPGLKRRTIPRTAGLATRQTAPLPVFFFALAC